MEKELLANVHKGDWQKWKPTPADAIVELEHHLKKIKLAMNANNPAQVSEFTADLANIAMKVEEIYGDGN